MFHVFSDAIGGAELYKCELCKVVFMQQCHLVDHYSAHHNLDTLVAETTPTSPQQASPDEDMTPMEDSVPHETSTINNMTDLAIDGTIGAVISDQLIDLEGLSSMDNIKNASEFREITMTITEENGNTEKITKNVSSILRGIFNAENAIEVDGGMTVDSPPGNAVTSHSDSLSLNGVINGHVATVDLVNDSGYDIDKNGMIKKSNDFTDDVVNVNGDGVISLATKVSNEAINSTDLKLTNKPHVTHSTKLSAITKPDIPDFSFILITEMVKGSTFAYGKTWFKCLHCEYKTTGKIAIAKHMNDKHKDMLQLHQSFDIKENLQNDKKKVMKMSAYENLFGREGRLKRRNRRGRKLEKQDMPGVFPCDRCGKNFHRLRYLRKHVETHRSDKKFLCDECGKSFKSRTYLTVHRRTHNEKLFKCNQCDFTCKVNAAIHAHRQIHSQGSVLCDVCGFAYTDKSTLNKHKRVHDLSRPFACNFAGCTWRFKSQVMCKAHIRAHTTEGKFRCSLCGYAFRHKHHLQRHETNMHGVKHIKPKEQSPRHQATETLDSQLHSMINCVVIDQDGSEQLHNDGAFSEQHLVVATDTHGTPITFEGTDLSAFNVAYQSLLATQDGDNSDAQTILLTQPEGQIVFQQE